MIGQDVKGRRAVRLALLISTACLLSNVKTEIWAEELSATLTDEGLILTLIGEPGETYYIERTDDFSFWDEIATIELDSPRAELPIEDFDRVEPHFYHAYRYTPVEPVIDQGEAGSVLIQALVGGEVKASDGAVLVVPPGALDQDQEITVIAPSDLAASDDFMAYRFLPEGLRFSEPARFEIPIEIPGDPVDFPWRFYTASALNPTLETTFESTNWQDVDQFALNPQTGTVGIDLEHFTFVYATAYIRDLAHLVLDIPLKYLLPGDMLFTLTSFKQSGKGPKRPNWRPGHVGAVLKPTGGTDPRRVIHADGERVKRDRIDGFRDLDDEGHLYLGARRVKGGLNGKERQNVVRVLRRQNGKGYNKLGTTGDKTAHSCVSLVEFALDAIGRGALSSFQEAAIPTPYELYQATSPVNEITVDVGERITIPIYSAIAHPSRAFVSGAQFAGFDNEFYTREMLFRELGINGFYYEISMDLSSITSSPATFRASSNPSYRLSFTGDTLLKPNGRVFKWTPEPKHAGKSFPLPLQLDAAPSLTVNGQRRADIPVTIKETLTIHVRPCITEKEPNDNCEQATPMGKSRCATGSIQQREASSRPQSPIIGSDTFKKTLAPGTYRATLDTEQASIQIEVEGEAPRAARGELKFEVEETGSVCATIFTFTPIEAYTLTIQELRDFCDTGFYFHNGSDATIGFHIVARDLEPIPVSIPPGGSFEQLFDRELANLNMIGFNLDGELVGGDGDMLFDLEVRCGRAQNFVWADFLSFEQTPVFEPLPFFSDEIAVEP